jgi:antibiotic biosynthesis monooxygenase (ABM) superfamily enzyme
MEPITISTTRLVKPGYEEVFERELHEFVAASLMEPGQLGVHVLRPAPGSGSREYGILRKFSDAGSRDTFYSSQPFADWLKKVDQYCEGQPSYEEVSGLETWFTLPGGQAIFPPPRWKMALVTLLAVYPVSMAVPIVLQPIQGNWPFLIQALLNSAGIVVVLTWLVMPLLSRLFYRWLYPGVKRRN